MAFWDEIVEFGEGAWEQVSTGAQNALGEWAGGGNDDSSSPAANVNSGQDANATTTTGESTAANQPVLFGMNQQSLMIGAGVLLAVVLVLKK